jgi:hypothetical protein
MEIERIKTLPSSGYTLMPAHRDLVAGREDVSGSEPVRLCASEVDAGTGIRCELNRCGKRSVPEVNARKTFLRA